MQQETFPPMWRVIPPGERDGYQVEHCVVDESASRMTALHGGRSYVPPGKYARLLLNGHGWDRQTLMSDTPYERRTNAEVVRQARGRVLIAGLGLGMVLTAILRKPEVREVVVVECAQPVVDLVAENVRAFVGKRAAAKLRIVVTDIFNARRTVPQEPYDCLWFDIWGDVSTDALQEMTTLTRSYRALRSPGAWMECWDREWLRCRREQERRAGW